MDHSTGKPVSSNSISELCQSTFEPFYNMVCYNTVLDMTRIRVGPQMAVLKTFSNVTYAFYSGYDTVWIINTEIGLDPKNSVIKRLC